MSAKAIELQTQIAEVKASIVEIKDSVANSLSLRNMGAGFIMNMAIDLEAKLAKAETLAAELVLESGNGEEPTGGV